MAKNQDKKDEKKEVGRKVKERAQKWWRRKSETLGHVIASVIALLVLGLFFGQNIAEFLGIESRQLTTADLFVLAAVGIVWVIFSLEEVFPEEIALGRYFGHLERREKHGNKPRDSNNGIFGSGLHFIPWFPLIELVKIPKTMYRLSYEKEKGKPGSVMSGNMLGARSMDKQKLFVEADFFVRFPYDDVSSLILLIESGVPFEEEALRDWLEDAFSSDFLYVFGKRNYTEVMGGRANEELNEEINQRLRGDPMISDPTKWDDSLMERCGLFGKDSSITKIGSGEAFLKIKDVHLMQRLGESLERVETERLGVEASKSIADQGSEETAGMILKMVAAISGLPLDAPRDDKGKVINGPDGKPLEGLREKLATNAKLRGMPASDGGFKEAFEYAKDQVKRDRAAAAGELSDTRVGNTDGSPMDPILGAVIAGAASIASQFGKGDSGKSDDSKGKKKKKKRNKGKSSKDKDDEEDDNDDDDLDDKEIT